MTNEFRTMVPVRPNASLISHESRILCMGSCFAEHIGEALTSNQFHALCNPTGSLFNPSSIASALRRLLDGRAYSRGDVFSHDGLWKSFDHHSSFADSDPDDALCAMNDRFSLAAALLPELDFLLVTFGTAAVYCHKETGRIAANCHKLPHDRFERRLLSVEEIVTDYRALFARLLERRPALSIIITVSPVRHLRDDPHENQVSKSRLIAAVDELERLFPQVYYFPAYEIMMDELRDYRFYEADMAHPSETAVCYIWERFCEGCVAERSRMFIEAFEPVRLAQKHRLQSPQAASTQEFVKGTLAKIDELQQRYPEVDLRKARGYFEGLLNEAKVASPPSGY
jgi:hypothetical protein